MTIHLGYYQFEPKLGQKAENLQQVSTVLARYAGPLDILVLPELFNTGYYFTSIQEVLSLSESPQGETYQTLKKLAKTKNCYIFGGFAEREGDHAYNSSMLVAPSGEQWIYRKAHLFAEEKLFFKPAQTPLQPIEIEIRNTKVKLGLMICFDWFFPETARTLALQGAQILLHTANLVMPYCPAATVTRCLENRVFTVLCNRTGKDTRADSKTLAFIGQSRIVNPKGQVLTQSDENTEEIQTAEINPADADDKNLNPLNNLFQDRRTDLYKL